MWPDEVAHLEEMVASLPDDAKIMEWGSGGSTTMLLENLKPKQTLVSIEHNPDWFNKICEALRDHPKREQLQYYFVKMNLTIEKHGVTKELDHEYWGYGDPPEENPCFLYQYMDPFFGDPVLRSYDADLYLVDGIARGPVMAKIFMNATKRQAPVYIHDYVGRESWYEWIATQYSKKEIVGHTLCKFTM